MAGRVRRDVRFWAEHLARQQASGLKLREYCRREGIEIHQFYYWRKRAMAAVPVAQQEPTARQVKAAAEEAARAAVRKPASVNQLDCQQAVVIHMNDLASIHVPGHMLETLEAVLKMIQRLSDQGTASDIGAFRSVVVRS